MLAEPAAIDLGPTRSHKSRAAGYDAAAGVLTITAGRRVQRYRVAPLAVDLGYGEGRGFRLTKLDGGDVYDVFLGAHVVTCDCPAKTYGATVRADWRHHLAGDDSRFVTAGCCHADALLAVVAAGLL